MTTLTQILIAVVMFGILGFAFVERSNAYNPVTTPITNPTHPMNLTNPISPLSPLNPINQKRDRTWNGIDMREIMQELSDVLLKHECVNCAVSFKIIDSEHVQFTVEQEEEPGPSFFEWLFGTEQEETE